MLLELAVIVLVAAENELPWVNEERISMIRKAPTRAFVCSFTQA